MMYQDVRFLFQDDHKKAGNFMKKWEINSVPIVDSDYRIVDIVISAEDVAAEGEKDHALKGIPIIIMAGGRKRYTAVSLHQDTAKAAYSYWRCAYPGTNISGVS